MWCLLASEPGSRDRGAGEPGGYGLVGEGVEGGAGGTCCHQPCPDLVGAVAGGVDLVLAVVRQPTRIAAGEAVEEIAIEPFVDLARLWQAHPVGESSGA